MAVNHSSEIQHLLPYLLPVKNQAHFLSWALSYNLLVFFVVRTVGVEPTWLLTAGT